MTFDPHEHLRQQLGFLDRSCAAFDAGYEDEATRIAVTLRVLFHQTKKSTSLLTHLGASPRLLSTVAKDLDYGKIPTMAAIWTGDPPKFKARLNASVFLSSVSVRYRWNQRICSQNGVVATRKDIILAAANRDGGAHVDDKLTPEYEALRDFQMMLYQVREGEHVSVNFAKDTHFVYLRQMGYEVLNSPELTGLVQIGSTDAAPSDP